MDKLKKSVVAAGLSVGLIGGGAAGVILGAPMFAGAQEATTTTVTTTAPSTTEKADKKADWQARRSERLQSTLKPLVESGTITQAQADAVVKALAEEGPSKGDKGNRGDRPAIDGLRRGFHLAHNSLDAVSELLGVTPAELGKSLMDGQTLAQVAEAKGVAPQKVIDTLVAETKKSLDKAVTDEKLTRERADERLTKMTESITDGVNNGALNLKRAMREWRQGD